MNAKFDLIEVKSAKDKKSFLDFTTKLYNNDNNWIRPLNSDIEKIFDPQKNKKFRNGDAIRWILKDKDNEIVGKIAAFYDSTKPVKKDILAGGCGFFDCINNQEAANTLFNAAKSWLEEHQLNAMDGPINFGSRETFWGCLHDGFYEPNYNMPYNHHYYNRLFTEYGFQEYFKQFTYHMPIDPDIMDPSIKHNADRCKLDPKFEFTIIDPKQLEKYVKDFTTIFNEAWTKFPGVKPMSLKQSGALFNSLKRVIDKRTIIFGYYDKKPVGFFIMIPDLYQSYKKFNGNFGLINKIRLLYDLKVSKRFTKLIGLIFGVVPDFQKKGVAGGMIMHFADQLNTPGFHFTDLEMNWIGDFNPGMIKLVELLGAKVRKTHITYRYLFNRQAEFHRAKPVS